MKKDDVVILAATFLVGIMAIVFAMMFVYIGNHTDKLVSDSVVSSETSFVEDVKNEETDSNEESSIDTQLVTNEESVQEFYEEIEKLIVSEDEVNLVVEDTTIHEVEYESTYVNTVDLVPSTREKREIVTRNDISTANFMTSFVGKEQCLVTITTIDDDAQEAQVSVSVPKEVFLYNVENETSNSCELQVTIEGDTSIVKSIGWSCEASSLLALSKTSGENTVVSRQSDTIGDKEIKVWISYFNAEGVSDTEEIAITVHVLSMTDSETRLYDKKGIALYKDEEGEQPAYLADYAKQEVFYGAVKTTGWQEIDGETFYFTAAGWPVTGIQIIGGTRYTFDENGVLVSNAGERGIDVSRYQKDIDWEQVAADGIKYAIIRCGFRGACSGQLVEDSYFRQNIEGATSVGIKVGIYFFTQAITEQEAKEEALMALALTRDYHLDLPIFIDSENAVKGRANDLDKETRTRILKSFCDTIIKGGETAGVYASKCWYYDNLYADELEQYSIWVAQYSPVCNYKGRTDYWQYSSRGKVKGIEGYVDMNIVYTNR